MISTLDFNKKQILVVMCNQGDKLSFSNENVIVKSGEGKVKLQLSLYRVFIIFCVGSFSITTPLIEKTRKYGFYIALMSTGFRLIEMLGCGKEGNTLLKKRQYTYDELEIAKHIVWNKINTQKYQLKERRKKNILIKEAIEKLGSYEEVVEQVESLHELLGYEGLASKIYFRNHFDNINWKGRQPRIKRDYINATLDMGYTILFTFIEAILLAFGFDVYCGVLHRQFYMRKSLVCDIIEPFRVIIDAVVKKGINLKQIKEEDFLVINYQYRLKWENSPAYTQLFMQAILEEKDDIFIYIQTYYRSFVKESDIDRYPIYQRK